MTEKQIAILMDKAGDRAETLESMGAGKADADDLIIYIDEIGLEEGFDDDVIAEAKIRVEMAK